MRLRKPFSALLKARGCFAGSKSTGMNGSGDGCHGAGVQIEKSRDTCGLLDDGGLVLPLPWGVGAGCGAMARLALTAPSLCRGRQRDARMHKIVVIFKVQLAARMRHAEYRLRVSQRLLSAHPRTLRTASRSQLSLRISRDRSLSARAACKPHPPHAS
jgi:hypothetical protein